MKGWKQEGNEKNTFRKRHSQMKSKRTQESYTLRGRDLSVQQTLRKLAQQFKTIGSGNLLKIIDIPQETLEESIDRVKFQNPQLSDEEVQQRALLEAKNEWLAANTVDFYNEVSLLYGLVEEFHQQSSDPATHARLVEEYNGYANFPAFFNGFPQGFEYRLRGGNGKVSSPHGADYVHHSMIWLEDQIDNTKIFPEEEDDPFPPKFIDKYVKEMFKRMFRIFAIIYAVCWPFVVSNQAEAHVNTCFKHFYFFLKRFDLLKRKADKDVFLRTKVKKVIDLTALDQKYQECLVALEKGE
eukprot:snap_masked-scaffold_8-processed-gene-0.7-mRNA-1 protein AED:0.12 eAED:0.24 QI:0/-1/0/1/-1/1/1/0/296